MELKEVVKTNQQKHFVLVHGACHGAWCWYKLKPLLESAGQRVTAMDLSASGINTKSLDDLHTLDDYAEPLMKLMASIPDNDKVILVGHSFGGTSLALAMENYPQKISMAVFVASVMPHVNHPPFYTRNLYSERFPITDMLDLQLSNYGPPEKPRTMLYFGPKYLSTILYQLCSIEDIELAKLLVRPSPFPTQDFWKEIKFSAEGYGSVSRAYVVCNQDETIKAEFQHWLVENVGVTEVKEIKDADHMAMLSKPKELCQCLLEIAEKCN